MTAVKHKYITGTHLKTLEGYTSGKKFTEAILEKKGEQYGIICKWLL
jgi:hypothetical protein